MSVTSEDLLRNPLQRADSWFDSGSLGLKTATVTVDLISLWWFLIKILMKAWFLLSEMMHKVVFKKFWETKRVFLVYLTGMFESDSKKVGDGKFQWSMTLTGHAGHLHAPYRPNHFSPKALTSLDSWQKSAGEQKNPPRMENCLRRRAGVKLIFQSIKWSENALINGHLKTLWSKKADLKKGKKQRHKHLCGTKGQKMLPCVWCKAAENSCCCITSEWKMSLKSLTPVPLTESSCAWVHLLSACILSGEEPLQRDRKQGSELLDFDFLGLQWCSQKRRASNKVWMTDEKTLDGYGAQILHVSCHFPLTDVSRFKAAAEHRCAAEMTPRRAAIESSACSIYHKHKDILRFCRFTQTRPPFICKLAAKMIIWDFNGALGDYIFTILEVTIANSVQVLLYCFQN